jgi:hypothetical protein
MGRSGGVAIFLLGKYNKWKTASEANVELGHLRVFQETRLPAVKAKSRFDKVLPSRRNFLIGK